VDDTIKAFSFNASGLLDSTPASETSTQFNYPGATPCISGSSASNLILWAAENTLPKWSRRPRLSSSYINSTQIVAHKHAAPPARYSPPPTESNYLPNSGKYKA